MAESAEHLFLSNCVSETLNSLARSNLYAYAEAERRKFDFAGELVRDWSRPLVGQTLWNHTAGLDKDLRTMLLDQEAEICAYVARDTMKARRLLSEAMKDFRSSGSIVSPHRLRVFWVPQDFDADIEEQRDLIQNMLAESVGRDILMNVVFGNLTPDDVKLFARTSGTHGLHFALLHALSTSRDPYTKNKDLAARFAVSQGAIRERLIRLLGCGFLNQVGGGATVAQVTPKGRVFLDLCVELWQQSNGDEVGPEMVQILRLLGLRYDASVLEYSANSLHFAGAGLTEVPEMITGRLIASVAAASERWGIDPAQNIDHVVLDRHTHPSRFLGEGLEDFVARVRAHAERPSESQA